MEKSFIYTENMTVGYDGKALIRDIRLSLEKGQILTLIGPNGAGLSETPCCGRPGLQSR